MGYIGQSMSERAALAYEFGEKPWSKWHRAAILDRIEDLFEDNAPAVAAAVEGYAVEAIRRALLVRSSWHHTGSCFNATDFYEIDPDLEATPEGIAQVQERLEAAKAELKAERAAARAKPEPEVRRVSVAWEEFNPWRRKWIRTEAVGVIRGAWFTADSGARKKVGGKHFWVLGAAAA